MDCEGVRLEAHTLPPRPRGRDEAAASNRKLVILQKEVAMRIVLRCSECDNEDPKIISLRNPAYEHYCGRACFLKGQESYIRWVLRMKAEVAT
jgi:hypothetical protein